MVKSKLHSVAYNAVDLHRLAVVASQVCEIPRNSPKIRTYSSSRSSNVSLSMEKAYTTSY